MNAMDLPMAPTLAAAEKVQDHLAPAEIAALRVETGTGRQLVTIPLHG